MTPLKDSCDKAESGQTSEIWTSRKEPSIVPLDSAYKVLKSDKCSGCPGRCVLADRDIREGDLIAVESPISIGPHPEDLHPDYCMGCLEDVGHQTKIRCPGCNWPACDINCSGLTDPLCHALECKLLNKARFIKSRYSPVAVLVFRIFLLQIKDPPKWKRLVEAGLDLWNFWPLHIQMLKMKIIFGHRFVLEQDILRQLRQADPTALPDTTNMSLTRIALVATSYLLAIDNPTTGKFAVVSDMASFMQHCCAPNTRVYFEYPVENCEWRTRILVRAAKDIQKGEHLTVLVTDPLNSSLLRQRDLYMTRGVYCKCQRCLDPTEFGTYFGSFKCGNCKQRILPLNVLKIDKTHWQCTFCSGTFTRKNIRRMTVRYTVEIHSTLSPANCTLDHLEALLSRLEYYLPYNNYFCVLIRTRYAKEIGYVDNRRDLASLTDKDLTTKINLCLEVLNIILKFMMVGQSYILCVATCVTELVYANLEMIHRKVLTEALSLDEAKKEIAKNRKYFIRAMRLYSAKYIGPEEAQKDESEEEQLAFLAESKKSKDFDCIPIPEEFLM